MENNFSKNSLIILLTSIIVSYMIYNVYNNSNNNDSLENYRGKHCVLITGKSNDTIKFSVLEIIDETGSGKNNFVMDIENTNITYTLNLDSTLTYDTSFVYFDLKGEFKKYK